MDSHDLIDVNTSNTHGHKEATFKSALYSFHE